MDVVYGFAGRMEVPADVRAISEGLAMLPPLPADIGMLRSAIGAQRAAVGTVEPVLPVEQIVLPGCDVAVRVAWPEVEPRAVLVHVHGGGWSFGAAVEHDATMAAYARNFGMVAMSVDYRLAPEHPYPAPLDDVYAVLVALAAGGPDGAFRGRLDRAPLPIVAVGESAGANLVLSAVLRMDLEHRAAVSAMALYFGAYDLTMTPSQRQYGERGLINSVTLPWFYTLYAAGHPLDDPEISPLYADLCDLPSTLLLVGTDDPLRDDSSFLFARMVTSGVDVRMHEAPGGVHGFQHFPSSVAEAATASFTEFVSTVVGVGPIALASTRSRA